MRSTKSKVRKIKLLKDYFKNKGEVLMAFVFGSQVKRVSRKVSDWDIGVYFRPKEYLELETEIDYPNEDKIWSDLIDMLETDNVDLVVLNRARPDLVYTVLRDGLPLIIRDQGFYLDLLCKTHYEAIDWWDFVFEFWKLGEKAKSLTLQTKAKISERLRFLEEEFKHIQIMEKITWEEFQEDIFKGRALERWVERLVMASIDIAEIILASQKRQIPESYKDTLKVFAHLELKFSEKEAEKFSRFASLRNIIAHEYLDIKWKKIKNFIKESKKLYPKFIKNVCQIIK